MNYRRPFSLLTILIILCAIIYLLPQDALARAGGGGGGKGGGLLYIILLPFLIIYSAIITYLVNKKSRECKDLLQKISKLDNSWDMTKIKDRIEIAFFKIQEAWMARDQEIAREYMSDGLYNKHKAQTDQMLRENRKNVLERINLKEAQVVEVADFEGDTKDNIWVYIKGSMIDYISDSQTGELISGKKDDPDTFTELWKFIKNKNNKWVLDEIDQKVEISDLTGFKSYSHKIENA
jgi:hypothetical protein